MYDKIKQLFPGIADSEFKLQDDGQGPYIARWDREEPQPTAQDLAAVVVPPAVPAEVTMRQARLALAAAGKLAAVDAAISSLSEPQKSAAQIEWEYSAAVRRTQPLVLALAPAIGLSDEQLDALFIQAAAL
jgi:hypothetical protein